MNGCCCFSLLFPSSKIRTLQINCFCFFGSMAAASLCGFISFLLPSQPQIAKNLPTQLIASYPRLSSDSLPIRSSSSSYMSFQSRRKIDGVFPVMENGFSSSNDFLSVVCPSLVNANILFFKAAYNVQVIVDENEPDEKLLGRFRREVMKAGVIQECKRRRFYENKQDEKKRKSREAARRNRRRRMSSRIPQRYQQEAEKNKKKEDEEEDNWELPEGDLP